MNNITVGLVAHVDAGKTSLAEALLFHAGKIKKIGRVDKADAYLDTFDIEKQRGITVYSKEAVFSVKNNTYYLIDTPGHIDFSREMERSLSILDIAVLVISANEGVVSHTKTLWKLLNKYNIPTIIFINKMDMATVNKDVVKKNIKQKLSENCFDFNNTEDLFDNISLIDEDVLNHYLLNDNISNEVITRLIYQRKLFPCFYGSALKDFGIDELLDSLNKYCKTNTFPQQFGAKIFKISRDSSNNRLTHLKITGGSLKVKDTLTLVENEITKWSDKVNEIKIYSGNKFENINIGESGTVCVVTGLKDSLPFDNLGFEKNDKISQLQSLFTYSVILDNNTDSKVFIPLLKEIEEEQPDLQIEFNEITEEIQVKVMGKLQLEILKKIILDRFNINIEFADGKIIYKETITKTIEGVGHFEPLRHYAEVHLIMEPGIRNSGMQILSEVTEEGLDKNWENMIMSHIKEKKHRGVLTNSLITDIKITVVNGKIDKNHTSGGDFREATYRAIRQGLMMTECILLEPYYNFELIIPENNIGRALFDLDKRKATFNNPEIKNNLATITGICAVSSIFDYYQELLSYTKGEGSLNLSFDGYGECHNSKEVISNFNYNPNADKNSISSSIFCKQGSGFIVEWDKVYDYMHLPLTIKKESVHIENKTVIRTHDKHISNKEVQDIFNKTYYSNSTESKTIVPSYLKKKKKTNVIQTKYVSSIKKERYLLVDGYNVIFSWSELDAIAKNSISASRERLINILNDYKSFRNINVILVFDAYKVDNHQEERYKDGNIDVVYTKKHQTADTYIEKFSHQEKDNYIITVVTSDRLEGIIARGNNAIVISSEKFKDEIEYSYNQMSEHFNKK
jgi:small GTP-binding protein